MTTFLVLLLQFFFIFFPRVLYVLGGVFAAQGSWLGAGVVAFAFVLENVLLRLVPDRVDCEQSDG